MSEKDREHLVGNIAVHIKNVKSKEVLNRQRMYFCTQNYSYIYIRFLLCPVSVFATVDQSLADRVAAAVGVPSVSPLKVKPAPEAVRYKFRATA